MNFLDDGNREEGRNRTIECELAQDLVDQCVPGDEISVCGVVKFTDAETVYSHSVTKLSVFHVGFAIRIACCSQRDSSETATHHRTFCGSTAIERFIASNLEHTFVSIAT